MVRQLQIKFTPSPSRRGTVLQDFNRPLDSAAILFANMDQFSAGDGKQFSPIQAPAARTIQDISNILDI